MVDDDILDWLRRVHQTPSWTVSVCTGALILGAAGILKGQPATTHWYKMGVLRCETQAGRTRGALGKTVTAAGVSAGIRSGALAGRRNRRS